MAPKDVARGRTDRIECFAVILANGEFAAEAVLIGLVGDGEVGCAAPIVVGHVRFIEAEGRKTDSSFSMAWRVTFRRRIQTRSLSYRQAVLRESAHGNACLR